MLKEIADKAFETEKKTKKATPKKKKEVKKSTAKKTTKKTSRKESLIKFKTVGLQTTIVSLYLIIFNKKSNIKLRGKIKWIT